MRSFIKFGLVLLACLICSVTFFADFFAASTYNLKVSNRFHYYFPNDPEQNMNKDENKENVKRKTFNETFTAFPWDDFKEAVAKWNFTASISYSKLLIDELTYFLVLEPLVPVNLHCTPPPLPSSTEIDCTVYPNAFNGVKRSEPAKVGVLIQFGFDVDVLEIHMNELFDVVDKFFLIESTQTHYGRLAKPLLWELVKQQERFKKFPVVHFIIDDAVAQSSEAANNKWSMELLQERERWLKFLQWNAATKYFSDDDVIGFGDADEIPNRAKLNMFKYCEIEGDSIDFGIWFPFGHINQAFQCDYPVPGFPLTLGDPTYFTLASAKKFAAENPNEYPSRRRGLSGHYMLGGIHLTHYGYLPFQIIKRATATEEGIETLEDVQKLSKYLKTGDVARMEVDLAAPPKIQMTRIKQVNVSDPEMMEICLLPWFYDCNRKRYPVWEDGHDTRLD